MYDDIHRWVWEWITQNASAFPGREEHTMNVMSDDSIVVMGGYGGISTLYNDVWHSVNNGVTWHQHTTGSPWWSVRANHVGVLTHAGVLLLIGGGYQGSSTYYNDVYYSTDYGQTWGLKTAAGEFSGRLSHAGCVLADNTIIISGGYNYSNWMNDVWKSVNGGITWTQQTASAEWSDRAWHSMITLPDDSILLTGGRYSSTAYNDVWRSVDEGQSWTELDASADWGGRYGHSMVILSDDSIILTGGSDAYDIWRSIDNGTSWSNVVSDPYGAGHTRRAIVNSDDDIIVSGGWLNRSNVMVHHKIP